MHRIELKMDAAQAALRKALGLLADMTLVYTDIGEYMVQATRDRFARGVSPDGAAWAPKKQSTLDRYKRMGYGALTSPLIGPSKRLSREVVTQPTRNGVIIGSALIYSRVMQEGAAKGAFGNDAHGRPIPWGRIAARAWLGVSDEDERNIVATVQEHIVDSLQPGG